MKNIVLTEAGNGYSVSIETDQDISCVWGIDGGNLIDAIYSACSIAIEEQADNYTAWKDFIDNHCMDADSIDYIETEIKSHNSSLDYRWGFNPADYV